ncbi:hypothetical protein ANCDUO_02478 [Ancylostoma duodenale]|uniref:ISXO2-like transposase domain-containing protein n=1 Tax=Ancylostoma duodenale TaxID=51022 RepID=A0A0C2H6P2_9BILA|nr:hypothetical protein ANCDUO_02478 [Ancylostoma duodenale]
MWICHTRGYRSGSSRNSKPSIPAKKGSCLDTARIPLAKIFALSYFWVYNSGQVVDKKYELGIGHDAQLEQYFRDICCEYFRRNRPILGGPGHVMEIDETCITKRKYNRGLRRHQWFFGGYKRGSGISFLILVRRRDARTMLRLVAKYVRPGTTIGDDCWRSYRVSTLPQGFTHPTVDHQLNFVVRNKQPPVQRLPQPVSMEAEILKREEAFYNIWSQVADLFQVPC